MKIVCAPDSFKGSMTAMQAARALADGVRAVVPDAQCEVVPLADGGEGFAQAIADALGAQYHIVEVHDSLGRPREAGFWTAGGSAVIEVAEAVGLRLVAACDRRICSMTSAGVGELISAALDLGVEEILIGLGGSGTNDGGAGMLRALGMSFIDEGGRDVDGSPECLGKVRRIDVSGLDGRLRDVRVRAACDVDNPLCGPRGASAVYGPQKGATPRDVKVLDRALATFAHADPAASAHADKAGAGAAGGLGFALSAFLGASLESGVDLVMEGVGLVEVLRGADLVLTGEGSIDRQSVMGKTISGVARLAREAGSVPVIACGGRIEQGQALTDELLRCGIIAAVPIVPGPCSTDEAVSSGERNLRATASRVMRIWMARAGKSPWCSR